MKKNRPDILERFKIDSEVGILEKWAKGRKDMDEKLKLQLRDNHKFPITRNLPYLGDANAAALIHSIETGTPRRINCNVKNNGLVTNLLEGCCVEVPCLVDEEGIHPCMLVAFRHNVRL